MYASSNTFLECRSPERLQPLKHDSCALCTITDGLDVAVLLNNDDDKLTSPLGSAYTTGSSGTEPDGADPAPQKRDPLHLLSGPPPLLPSPPATPCGPEDWPLRTARQAAKRARVENIIRDMAGSSFSPSPEPEADGAPEDGRGDKGPREWPPDGVGVQAQRAGRSGVAGCRASEDPAIKSRLQNVKCQPLLKSRGSGGLPSPEDWERDSDRRRDEEETPLEETHSFGSDSPSKDPRDTFADPHCWGDGGLDGLPLNRKACGRKKVRVPTAGSPPRTPDAANALMADILKYELSRAVSMSVDSIFRSMPRLEPRPAAATERSATAGLPHHHHHHRSPLRRPRQGTPPGTSPYGETVCGSTLPDVQTEALSLVVQRPPRIRPHHALRRPPHQHHGEQQESPPSHRSEPQGCEGGGGGGATEPVGRAKNACEGLKQEALAAAGAPGSKLVVVQ